MKDYSITYFYIQKNLKSHIALIIKQLANFTTLGIYIHYTYLIFRILLIKNKNCNSPQRR